MAAFDYESHHKEFGYGRLTMFEADPTRGFVQYKRHVFICHGSSRDWPGDFVVGDPDSLPGKLLRAFDRREKEIKTKTIVTVCEASEAARLEDGDVLIFPDMRKYRLSSSTVDSFVGDVLVNDGPGTLFAPVELTQRSFVFVCAHAASDMRNGVCGEVLMKKLNELVEINQLKDVLFPIRCSDIGVPEFAANIIIFARDGEDKIDGHWYSYVSPSGVSVIIDYHFMDGKIYHDRWRGKMGNEDPTEVFNYPESWWWRGKDKSVVRKPFHHGVAAVGWGKRKVVTEPEPEPEPLVQTPTPPLSGDQYRERVRLMQMWSDGTFPIIEVEPEPIVGILSEEKVEKLKCAARRNEEEREERERARAKYRARAKDKARMKENKKKRRNRNKKSI